MIQVSYPVVRDLAATLAGRTPGEIPTTENSMLQQFFAAELADLWNKETWPELCDNMEAVTVTAQVFSKREGSVNVLLPEMGDILGVYDADPRSATTGWTALDWVEESDAVRVLSSLGTVYVDWQDPFIDLTDLTSAELTATTFSNRFRLPLAYRGAAQLLKNEDANLAASYERMADTEIMRQAGKLVRAWWRVPRSRVP